MTTKMTTKTNKRERSRDWYERAQQSLIEGVNSPSRGAAVYLPGPVVLERGRGSRVWDLDGNEYIDFMMSFGALIQGHANPKIVEVVSQPPLRRNRKRPSASSVWFRPRRRCASPIAAVKPRCSPCAWRARTLNEQNSSNSKATIMAGMTRTV